MTTPISPLLCPLWSEDGEVAVDLQFLVNDLYEQLGYDYFIDYTQAPPSSWNWKNVPVFTANGRSP